jgi:hypothetical protein
MEPLGLPSGHSCYRASVVVVALWSVQHNSGRMPPFTPALKRHRRLSFTAVAVFAMLAVGCAPIRHARQVQQDFYRATYSISGSELLVQNNDRDTWIDVGVLLKTDAGEYQQRTDDLRAGKVRALGFSGFRNAVGAPPGLNFQLNSVTISAKYPNQESFSVLAYPR